MAQSLELNIKTTSEVPQAMEKAKKATDSFGKQVEDIQKKFSTSFKDIFLGFTAPMVILQNVIGFISGAIEKAKRDAQEGLDLIAKGESKLNTVEESKMAQFLKAKQAAEEEAEAIKKGRQEMTVRFLEETDAGKELMRQERERRSGEEFVVPEVLALNPDFQKKALEEFLNSEAGKKFKPIFEDKQDKSFKGPEGFSNVIGVGANPVMEAMTLQLEEAKKQTALLEQIAGPNTAADGWISKESKTK
jgi:hypothetical protein